MFPWLCDCHHHPSPDTLTFPMEDCLHELPPPLLLCLQALATTSCVFLELISSDPVRGNTQDWIFSAWPLSLSVMSTSFFSVATEDKEDVEPTLSLYSLHFLEVTICIVYIYRHCVSSVSFHKPVSHILPWILTRMELHLYSFLQLILLLRESLEQLSGHSPSALPLQFASLFLSF